MSESERFLRGEYAALLRAAFLLTGDRTDAQDLAQETAVRVLVQWRKVSRAESPSAYSRKILLNVFLGGRRRAWHREVPHSAPPERPEQTSGYDGVNEQDVLRRALMALPDRQRAAVVLRHWEDRTEAETAALLGCSVGNVKSLTSRGLAQLRLSLGDRDVHQKREGTASR